MKLFKKLDHNLLTAIILVGVGMLGFIASCFLISSDLQDIPFGFLLAGGVLGAVHALSFGLNEIDRRRGAATFTIMAMFLRLMILLITIILIALMNYRWNIKLFNMFVFVGMYTLGIIVLSLTFIFDKDGRRGSNAEPGSSSE